jgi:hypothetical protein
MMRVHPVPMRSVSLAGVVRHKLALALALLLPTSAYAQAAAEYAAKAAFIYNIALFSNFPSGNTGLIRLCVLGRDPFGGILNSLDGKRLGEARMTIAYPRSEGEALKQCQIVFISASEADNIATLADSGKEAGVMTISDTKGAARKGIMLELSVEDKRIAFEVNGEAARRANIALSSKVLRLARAVY